MNEPVPPPDGPVTAAIRQIVDGAESVTAFGKARQAGQLTAEVNTKEGRAEYAFYMAEHIGQLAIRLAIQIDDLYRQLEIVRTELRNRPRT